MSKKNKKKKKEQRQRQNANITPSILEEKNAATSRIEAEQEKQQLTPKPAEKKRTPEEIAAEANMTSWQRYKKSLRDSWQLEKDTMATMDTRREKVGYFIYYHKWQILVTLLVVFTFVYGLHAIVTHKDYAFNCVVVNDSYNETFPTVLESEIKNSIDYDSSKYMIGVNCFSTDISNYDPGYYGGDSGCQSIFTQMTDYLIDTMIADQDVIEWFSEDDNFCNLEDTLPSDMYKELEPYIILCKDTSGEEHPYALDISKTRLYKEGKSNLATPSIAIYNTTRHLEDAIALIKNIFDLE
ncbi:MAG: hypothetical protein PUC39_02135 [Lachnospiraceae bacterium]|nr:hypothetical protein [Lachnospiraceae bacterium]